MDKLGHLDEDLRKNIAIEQDKKKVLSEQYGHCGKLHYSLYNMIYIYVYKEITRITICSRLKVYVCTYIGDYSPL